MKKLRKRYFRYARSHSYAVFVRRQYHFPWYHFLAWLAYNFMLRESRKVAKALAFGGDPLIGVVLMRNTELGDKKAAGPALVLGSSNISPRGFEELHIIAERIEEFQNHENNDIRNAVNEIYLDMDYQQYRRRKLPECLDAPAEIRLFDEMMRGTDFLDVEFGGVTVPFPFCVLLANPHDAASHLSVVVPMKIGMPILQYLNDEHDREESGD